MNQWPRNARMQRYLRAVDWKRLREELEICRKVANLNQSQLGAMIGKNKSTIGRIENVHHNAKHRPDLDTIEKIVTACGLSLSVFFRRVEQESGSARPIPDEISFPVADSVTYVTKGAQPSPTGGAHDQQRAEISDIRRIVAELLGHALAATGANLISAGTLPITPSVDQSSRKPVSAPRRRRAGNR